METDPNQVPILRLDLQKIDLLQYVKDDELLWKSQLFKGLDEQAKISLIKSGLVRQAKLNELILGQVASREIFMVLDGSVVLSIQQGSIDLATLTKGDFFGLTAVFRNAPMVHATAASHKTRLAAFNGGKVTSLAVSNPSFGKNLAYLTKQRSVRARECADFMDNW